MWWLYIFHVPSILFVRSHLKALNHHAKTLSVWRQWKQHYTFFFLECFKPLTLAVQTNANLIKQNVRSSLFQICICVRHFLLPIDLKVSNSGMTVSDMNIKDHSKDEILTSLIWRIYLKYFHYAHDSSK
jgi:hypothetical protein